MLVGLGLVRILELNLNQTYKIFLSDITGHWEQAVFYANSLSLNTWGVFTDVIRNSLPLLTPSRPLHFPI